jgi:hypothetical protein
MKGERKIPFAFFCLSALNRRWRKLTIAVWPGRVINKLMPQTRRFSNDCAFTEASGWFA